MTKISQYGRAGYIATKGVVAVLPAHECLEHAGCPGVQSEIYFRGRKEPLFADQAPAEICRRINEDLEFDKKLDLHPDLR